MNALPLLCVATFALGFALGHKRHRTMAELAVLKRAEASTRALTVIDTCNAKMSEIGLIALDALATIAVNKAIINPQLLAHEAINDIGAIIERKAKP